MSYTLAEVRRAKSVAFAEAHAMLAAEFAARGELERREVIEGWLNAQEDAGETPLLRRYHLVTARDEATRLVGVRDCHVVVDPARAIVVVYLAHVVVDPSHRRHGLGAQLREEPVRLARAAIAAHGLPPTADVLLAAEMEPVRLDEPPTLVRLATYGKAGFAAIPPRVLPYSQPDFRPPALIGDQPDPLPLLAVVKHLGGDGATLSKALCRAYQLHLDAVFATHCAEAHLAPRRERALAALDRYGADPVPLFPLPRDAGDAARIQPLAHDAVVGLHGTAARS